MVKTRAFWPIAKIANRFTVVQRERAGICVELLVRHSTMSAKGKATFYETSSFYYKRLLVVFH